MVIFVISMEDCKLGSGMEEGNEKCRRRVSQAERFDGHKNSWPKMI